MNGVQDNAPTLKEWIAIALIVPPLLLAALAAIGMMADGYGASIEQKERCLKRAMSGYEIQKCQ